MNFLPKPRRVRAASTERAERAAGGAVAVAAIAAAVLAVVYTPNAQATLVNVSQLVLGVAEPDPVGGGAAVVCGTACRYSTASGAQMSNGWTSSLSPYITASWPALFSVSKPVFDEIEDNLFVPQAAPGTVYETLPSGAKQRAQVIFSEPAGAPASERQLDVQTWRSGSGAAAVSYAVRIDTPPGPARRTYLRFGIPNHLRQAKPAGWFNGNLPVTEQPERLQARSAVDVIVDGLPVWSSSSTQLLPKRFNPEVPQTIEIDTGPALSGGDTTLFLGTLPGGSSRTAVIVMRSDLRVDAPTCHTVNNVLGNDWRRCDTRLEGLALPTQSLAPLYLHKPHFLVYTQ